MKNLILILSSVFLFACNSANKNQSNNYVEVIGKTQGTHYRIVHNSSNVLKSDIDSLFSDFDEKFNNYIPNSIISRYNTNDSSLTEFPEQFKVFMDKSFEIYSLTNGAFDISCAPLVNAWKFGFKNDSLLPDSAKVDSIMNFIGMDKIANNSTYSKQDNRIQIISNAIAQGYSVDLVANLLESKGATSYLIDVGGELRTKGQNSKGKTWVIGINVPKENSAATDFAETIAVENKSVATSGNYRKFYTANGKKYSHTIDPITGYPVRHSLLSATIITSDCIYADALATACMVIGLDSAKALINSKPNCEALFIYSQGDSLLTWKSFED